jgi:hypothetical protein
VAAEWGVRVTNLCARIAKLVVVAALVAGLVVTTMASVSSVLSVAPHASFRQVASRIMFGSFSVSTAHPHLATASAHSHLALADSDLVFVIFLLFEEMSAALLGVHFVLWGHGSHSAACFSSRRWLVVDVFLVTTAILSRLIISIPRFSLVKVTFGLSPSAAAHHDSPAALKLLLPFLIVTL